jgi:alanine dehydrogenase
MNIGTIREIKDSENRVGLTPKWTKELVKAGHAVWVEKGAGEGAGFADAEYKASGAILVDKPIEVVKRADILVKVKEPLPCEYKLLSYLKGKTLYTYLHLVAVDRGLTLNLIKRHITAIDYATVENERGALPLLVPMSEIAGTLSAHYAAEFLQKKHGGRGITIGHIHHVKPVNVVIVGCGVAGKAAAKTAVGMGARVDLFDIDERKVTEVKKEMSAFLGTRLIKNVAAFNSNKVGFANYIKNADVLIGAALVKGSKAPVVVSEAMVKTMKRGSVIVDIAIDQGGCIWGSRPTTHSNPIYQIEGKIFCCVANMPGQAPMQATEALTYTTFPHLLKMANLGVHSYLKKNRCFARGVNVYNGKVVYRAVAEALDLMPDYEPLNL